MADPAEKALDEIAAGCVAVRVRLLNRVVTNIYDEELRPLGLKVSQLNILVVSGKLGVALPAEVCRLLQLDASTLSRNVKQLRANGWLEVVPGDDARAQPLRLTAAGRALIGRAAPAWRRAQRRAEKLLGADAVRAIDQAAGKAREGGTAG